MKLSFRALMYLIMESPVITTVGLGFGVVYVVDWVEAALCWFCWLACCAEPCLALFFFFFLLTVVHPSSEFFCCSSAWSSVAGLLGFLHSAVDIILITSSKLAFSFSSSKILLLALPNSNPRQGWQRQEFSDTGAKVPDRGAKLGIRGMLPRENLNNLKA